MSLLDCNKKPLAELRALNLPRCRASDIFDVRATVDSDDARAEAAEHLRLLDSYLRIFVTPQKRDDGGSGFMFGNQCICCGHAIRGMLGSFTYGIAHGEGRCRACGYPARVCHYPKDDKGENVFEGGIQNLILQYHPDEVTEDRDDSDE